MEEDDDYDEEYQNILDTYKATGQNRVLEVGKVDGVPETRHNVELLLKALKVKLPEVSQNFVLVPMGMP